MNVEHILRVMQRHQVAFILIGGMNFLLRHQPVVTFDVDFWIELQDGALEVELSRLCAEVLACEARQQNYGVRLPNLSLAPNHGPQHQLKVLQALALC